MSAAGAVWDAAGGQRDWLDQFRVCSWTLASCDTQTYRRASEAAAAHDGAFVLETCQRVEAYSRVDCSCDAPLKLGGEEAVLHLAAVAAGVHSAVVGEEQVLGQVRAAATRANGNLTRAVDLAIGCARHLRKHERLNADSGELLDRALELSGQAPGGRALVLGSGHMARLITRRALALGFSGVTVASRRRPSPPWPRTGEASFILLPEAAGLDPVAVVVTCLGGQTEVSIDDLPAAAVYLDLGTPRNIDPGARAAEVVTVAGILEAEPSESRFRRARLESDLALLVHRRLAREARSHASGVAALRAEVEAVRRKETARIRQLHPEIPHETADAITRSLVNRLFHGPSERLRELEDPELASRVIEVLAPGKGTE